MEVLVLDDTRAADLAHGLFIVDLRSLSFQFKPPIIKLLLPDKINQSKTETGPGDLTDCLFAIERTLVLFPGFWLGKLS